MNYISIYDNLIKSRKILNRSYKGGFEKHHILPRCMGGSDEESNIVVLTYREHFLAHWILYKAYKTRKLAFAWRCMSRVGNGRKVTSIHYEKAKSAWVKNMRDINLGVPKSKEARANMSAAHIGKTPWNKGMKIPAAPSKQRLAYEKSPLKCKMCSKDIEYKKRKNTFCSGSCSMSHRMEVSPMVNRKANSGSFKRGAVVSQEVKDKISKALTGIKRETVECPNCGKVGDLNLMKRWHFDNCRSR